MFGCISSGFTLPTKLIDNHPRAQGVVAADYVSTSSSLLANSLGLRGRW